MVLNVMYHCHYPVELDQILPAAFSMSTAIAASFY
jgi:hypothetical protein